MSDLFISVADQGEGFLNSNFVITRITNIKFRQPKIDKYFLINVKLLNL